MTIQLFKSIFGEGLRKKTEDCLYRNESQHLQTDTMLLNNTAEFYPEILKVPRWSARRGPRANEYQYTEAERALVKYIIQ